MDPIEEILEEDGELYDGEGLDELTPALEETPSIPLEDDELDLI